MKRQTQTKAKIKAAFTQLLESKGFDHLTVSDIIRLAQINRSTFYKHYLDKFDLRDQLIASMVEQLMAILTEAACQPQNPDQPSASLSQAISQILTYLKEDQPFIQALVLSNQASFLTELLRTIINQFYHQIQDWDDTDHIAPQITNDYGKEILLAGIVSIFLLWVKKGMVDPIDTITQLIVRQVNQDYEK
ncbi:TetR/AcrR family transcriptional regulator [Streptococcus merionis]|uniref:Bacterial regulatory s, tetR family protein n=1 Tax=Streptococcus merionis TaxID=400065 RepID=A0A239SL66_9STRE|nr:TetR/AcrR family transcriptional regulator [Streptococcus merionis]SNU86151.1 bacterial regulatory s, tetR family protein [Streptococcus merionis]